MNILVAYDSKFGNTEKLAHAIGTELGALGPVEVRPVGGADAQLAGPVDLLVLGGPTEAHGMTSGVRAFIDAMGTTNRTGARTAVFDTRFRLPPVLTGSAAKRIARRLRRLDASLVAPPESFFVTRKGEPQLEEGELKRARAWAATLRASVLTV